MISGLCVTFSSSRMAELLMLSVRWAYRDFQSVDMDSPQDCPLFRCQIPQVSRFPKFQGFKDQVYAEVLRIYFETLKP
jgi:hypothetical protein